MGGVDGFVEGPADGVGKKIDNDVLTIGVDQVYRQRIRLAGTAATALVDVQATDPVGTEFGAVVRIAGVVPLPTGAATGAKQDTGNASLTSIDGKTPALVSGRVPVDASAVAVPVTDNGGSLTVDGTVAITAASLPLPANAAQETGGALEMIAVNAVINNSLLRANLRVMANPTGGFVPFEVPTIGG